MVWFVLSIWFRGRRLGLGESTMSFGLLLGNVFNSRVLDGRDGDETLMIFSDDIFTGLERYRKSMLIIM